MAFCGFGSLSCHHRFSLASSSGNMENDSKGHKMVPCGGSELLDEFPSSMINDSL